MACNCNGGRARLGQVTGYLVTTESGEQFGPFLTQTEARMHLEMKKLGGTITTVRKTA